MKNKKTIGFILTVCLVLGGICAVNYEKPTKSIIPTKLVAVDPPI